MNENFGYYISQRPKSKKANEKEMNTRHTHFYTIKNAAIIPTT